MKKYIWIVLMGLLGAGVQAETITHNGTTYGTVTSPYTGRVWLDRNLGASRVCTAFDDEQCYGDYYYLRNIDNTICPIGFAIPTIKELLDDTYNTGIDTILKSFNSFLKVPAAGAFGLVCGGNGCNNTVSSAGEYIFLMSGNQISNWGVEIFGLTPSFYKNVAIDEAYSLRCIRLANIPPTPKAGQDQTIIEGQTATLSASESNDTDGQIVSYEWKEGDVVLSTEESFSKSDFSVGTHIIVLTVTDDAGASASDEVLITVEERLAWDVIVESSYAVPQNRLFTKNFQISQYSSDTTDENLVVTLEGTSDVTIDIQKKDGFGHTLDVYRYKFVGNISETTTATLHVVDDTQGYDVSIPVTFEVSEYSITDVMPSQPFIIANGEDITYPFNVVFDVKVPAGSGVLPTCQITIPFDGSMRTIDLDVTLLEGKTDRYKCRTHTNYQDGYYLSALATLDEVEVSLGFDDQTKAYKVIKTPIFSRDMLTAKATLEYLFEYHDSIIHNIRRPTYVIVNKRIYRPNTIGFPKVIYLGGENAPMGVRKFNKDTVFMQGGIWRLSYMGHSIIIELAGYPSPSSIAFTVDGTQDVSQDKDIVKFITNPDSFYHMLISKRIGDNQNPVYSMTYGLSSLVWGTNTNNQMSISIQECKNSSDPLTLADALNWVDHPCVTNADGFDPNRINEDIELAVRGTTLEIHKETGKPIAFNLLEGEIEMSATPLEHNITLYDMQGLTMGDTSKHSIESTVLTPIQESYLSEHSLITADENTTVKSITIETNVDNASYILIGDQVQAGHGKQTVFERVAEGNYSMVYMPVSGYIEPNPKILNINEESTSLTLTDVYREADTAEYNTTSYYIAYDKNDTRQYALVMPSVQKIYTHEAGDITHLQRVDEAFVSFPVYNNGELCFSDTSDNSIQSAAVMAEQCYEVKFFYTQKECTDNGTAFMLYYKPADKLYEGIAGDASSFQVVKDADEIHNENSVTQEDYSHFRFDTTGAMAEIKTPKIP